MRDPFAYVDEGTPGADGIGGFLEDVGNAVGGALSTGEQKLEELFGKAKAAVQGGVKTAQETTSDVFGAVHYMVDLVKSGAATQVDLFRAMGSIDLPSLKAIASTEFDFIHTQMDRVMLQEFPRITRNGVTYSWEESSRTPDGILWYLAACAEADATKYKNKLGSLLGISFADGVVRVGAPPRFREPVQPERILGSRFEPVQPERYHEPVQPENDPFHRGLDRQGDHGRIHGQDPITITIIVICCLILVAIILKNVLPPNTMAAKAAVDVLHYLPGIVGSLIPGGPGFKEPTLDPGHIQKTPADPTKDPGKTPTKDKLPPSADSFFKLGPTEPADGVGHSNPIIMLLIFALVLYLVLGTDLLD